MEKKKYLDFFRWLKVQSNWDASWPAELIVERFMLDSAKHQNNTKPENENHVVPEN